MPRLTCQISQSVLDAIDERTRVTGDSMSTVVTHALADALGVDHRSLFQVSAAGALVAGVARGSLTVAELTRHGDFGIGTFDDFDGEMVVLDGRAYRVASDGVSAADPDARVPYAMVTDFEAQRTSELAAFGSYAELVSQLDVLRDTDNEFFAVRIDGTFDHMKTRAVCRSEGDNLVEAAGRQIVFEFDDVDGTVVGFWSPPYTRAITVTGWHLHFLSGDTQRGGHVLNCHSVGLPVQIERLADFHVAFPETPAFMEADMSTDHSKELADAETDD